MVHNCLLADEQRKQINDLLGQTVGPPAASRDNIVVYDLSATDPSRGDRVETVERHCRQNVLEKTILAIRQNKHDLPWYQPAENAPVWKVRRFDKIVVSGKTATRFNRVLYESKTIPVQR